MRGQAYVFDVAVKIADTVFDAIAHAPGALCSMDRCKVSKIVEDLIERKLTSLLISTDNNATRAIQFAVLIDDHFDRLEFLQGWIHGDVAEWPEFKSFNPAKDHGPF